ncbi:MAG: DUF2911 domain-containing protein [Bacteroidota bacterium]|nr:DUF2911 domain-containing protein [Bacteroidota bacterium]
MHYKSVLLRLFIFYFGITTYAFAQITIPKKSPYAKIYQKVGLTDINIEYSRPSARGRTIFGDLVPYNQLWRTGANASTKIKLSTDVEILGQEVPAGQYAIYTIPNKDSWEFVFHKNTSLWGTGGKDYTETENLMRFKVETQTEANFAETFQISIEDLSDIQCTIILAWGHTRVAFQVDLETDLEVLKNIDKAMQGVAANTYYSAASYYLDKQLDLNKALGWIDKAIDQTNSYWMVRKKAQILFAQNKTSSAIEVNRKALKLAEKAGREMYMNSIQKEIDAWQKED